MKERLLSEIKVSKRLRKDTGDLKSLIASIKRSGLLHPIVINKKNNLVAGWRRLKAYKLLVKESSKWRTIPVTVVDLPQWFQAEIDENVERKDFTVFEVGDIIKTIEKSRIGHRPKKGDQRSPIKKGKTRDVVAEITNLSPATIARIKTIHAAFKKAPKKYKKIKESLDKGKMSVGTAHKLVTQKERNLPKIPLPKGRFDVILADPSLRFDNRTIRGSSDNNYETMELSEICDLGRKLPTAKDAILFLWMPSSMFFDVRSYKVGWDSYYHSTLGALLHHWGFEPLTFFAWDKEIIGPGSWLRNQHENLVIAIKGKMPTPAKLYPSVIRARRTKKHSEKPDVVYTMIEKMYPKRKYLELFARKKRKGWTSWGNEIASKN